MQESHLPQRPQPRKDKSNHRERKEKERRRNPLKMTSIKPSQNSLSSISDHIYSIVKRTDRTLRYPDLKQQLSSAPTESTSTLASNTLASLLSVSLPHLDSEAEMRKFFGSKVVSAAKSSTPHSPGHSARGRQVGAQKSNLTRPQPSWWAAKQREGLSISAYTEEEVGDKLVRQGWGHVEEKWWTVEYSKKYKSVTMSFMQTVMSGGESSYALFGAFSPI